MLAVRPFVFTQDAIGDPNWIEMFVQVNNQLPDNSDASAGRVNTNNAIIERVELRFQVQGFAVLGVPGVITLAPVVFPLTQTVPAASSSTPVIPLITKDAMAVLAPLITGDSDGEVVVLAEVTLVGHLEDGTDFETAPHVFAVDVLVGITGTPICPTAGDVYVSSCPKEGQTSSIQCVSP
jgi:hypothetical protein